MTSEMMKMRSSLMGDIRSFFDSRDFIEVDTPLLSPSVLPETTIELFSTEFCDPYGRSDELYLLPSPEYWHKKLLHLHPREQIYQLSKAFRNSEQVSRIHNIEFTLLEWYMPDKDYRWSMGFTKQLIQHLSNRYFGEMIPFQTRSLKDLCKRHADLDLERCLTPKQMREAARGRGHRIEPEETWNDAFNRIFVSEVEPALESEAPLFIINYPKEIPCLAKETETGPYRERWELYWKGMEIANCYSEETDPVRVRNYMNREGEIKDKKALIPARWDRDFWKIYSGPTSASSGVALGFDRLLMILSGSTDISEVIYFPYRPPVTPPTD